MPCLRQTWTTFIPAAPTLLFQNVLRFQHKLDRTGYGCRHHNGMDVSGMGWSRRYAIVSYLRSSLWTVPLFALVVEQIGVRFLTFIDQSLQWVPTLEVTAAEAGDALATIASLTIAFVVFTFGSMLVALQVASAQLTPRIIATTLLRDNTIRFTVGLFVFTLLLAVGTKARLHDPLPLAMVTVAIVAGIGSMAAFLFLIDYTARLLRPTAICQRVAERGMAVIEAVYPNPIEHPSIPRQRQPTPCQPARTVVHEGRSAVVLALNLKALSRLARDADGVISFVPRVGDFVASAEPLFRLYGGTATLSDSTLRAQVAFGPERTMEQDATFAFRVIVDVAIKALSQAINDPTTAVLALDQIHRLLRVVGRRHLHDDAVYDDQEALRLILPTPNWDDFVDVAFSEIRLYGASNFQVTRRLYAIIEDLMNVLPETRQDALQRQLQVLNDTLERQHLLPENLTLARHPDRQGLGGSSTPYELPQSRRANVRGD